MEKNNLNNKAQTLNSLSLEQKEFIQGLKEAVRGAIIEADQVKTETRLKAQQNEAKALNTTLIALCKLKPRSINVLNEYGYNRVEDLKGLKPQDIKLMQNAGEVTKKDILDFCKKNNIFNFA